MIQPYYDDGKGIQIYLGDCREILPLLKADVIVTDPPYGIHKTNDYDDTEFPAWWIEPAWKAAPRILCMPGNWSLIAAGQAIGQYRQTIGLYSANGMTHGAIGFGNWIPVIAAGEWSKKARPDFIKFTVKLIETIDHPSPKPYAAMLKLLYYYTEPHWTIIDCFAGSGTTAKAAKELGRKCILIEREERYCEIAATRLSQEVFALEYA